MKLSVRQKFSDGTVLIRCESGMHLRVRADALPVLQSRSCRADSAST